MPDPDFLVAAIHYSEDGTHISHILRSQNKEGVEEFFKLVSATIVIKTIKTSKLTYFTTLLSKDAKCWIYGQKIEIGNRDGFEYLKTKNNETEKDNLINLPRI